MCSHLSEFYAKHGVKSYQIINANFSAPTSKNRRFSAFNQFCYGCHSEKSSSKNLFSCLHCIYLACKSHLVEHYKNKKHYIGVNLEHGMLYCLICSDYVYDSKFLKINEKNHYKAAKGLKKSISYYPWFPSETELAFLKQHPKRIISENNKLGLRGLFNLGSTCFMNCIIQVLIHTPVLRDYFLADRHNCKLASCMVCEISNIYQEFYSGKTTPLSLHDLLVLIWKNASHLAGYKQQDAHEFFIATLNLLHTHFRDSSRSQHDPCNCIIDELFTGELLSDLVCTTCRHVSPTFEPFKDLSLDLSFDTCGQPKSLLNCLERFTRLEHLGPNAKLTCGKCKAEREFTKELSIQTLPIIASFHLKRFEQTGLNDKKKISTFISFPDELDLTPFLAKSSQDNDQLINRPSAKYSLYAVVNHEGKSIDVGHYTSFIKHTKNYWIKCDDLNLIPYSLDRVLRSEGYLLFYHKKVNEYY